MKKGPKAIELLMPVLKKAKDEVAGEDQKKISSCLNAIGSLSRRPKARSTFQRPFQISRLRYCSMSGDSTGYARTNERIVAISPLAFDPVKTMFHEVAHVLLHPGIISDHEQLPKDVREVEAELTAYIVKSALGLFDNLEYSRGYIRNWITDTSLEKVRFSKVFAAADTILKAGREPKPEPTIPTDHQHTAPATLSL